MRAFFRAELVARAAPSRLPRITPAFATNAGAMVDTVGITAVIRARESHVTCSASEPRLAETLVLEARAMAIAG